MFFHKKGWLRKEFDGRLLEQLGGLKNSWDNQRSLVERSFDPSRETISQAKLAEAKYFYLFKEAKRRNVKAR
jgi:hypothetical protein